jgi:hypothetical protein
MATLDDIPVPFTILRNPAPVITGGPSGRTGRMHFLTALNDVGPFIQTIAGTVQTIPMEGGGTVDRIVPLVHPNDSGMFVVSYESEALGTPGGIWGQGLSVYTNMFSHARISLEFMSLPFADVNSSDPWYTINVDSGTTIETLPDQSFFFPGGEELTGEAGIPIPVINFNITTFMSTKPVGYTEALLAGRVNSAPFTTTDYGTFPPGFLRFAGARSEQTRGAYGTSLVKSYSLAFRPIEWNKSMRKSGAWDYPTTSGGMSKYLAGNLNILKY